MTKKETLKVAELIWRAAGQLLEEHGTSCNQCFVLEHGEVAVSRHCRTGLTLERAWGAAVDHRYTLEMAAQSLEPAELEAPA